MTDKNNNHSNYNVDGIEVSQLLAEQKVQEAYFVVCMGAEATESEIELLRFVIEGK